MTCADDAAFTGQIALFSGVETAYSTGWTLQKFVDLANFCKSHGVSTLFVKAFEVGSQEGAAASGLWYGGMNGIDAIYQALKSLVNPIFYGYLYGPQGDINQEIKNTVAILQKYGTVCLDIEGSQWGLASSAAAAAKLEQVLTPLSGKLWLSLPADFSQNNQQATFQALSPAVNVWMPMAYNDALTKVAIDDIHSINPNACIQPTFDLSQEFGTNNVVPDVESLKQAGVLAISFWYEGFAETAEQAVFEQAIEAFTGKASSTGGASVKKNADGTIMTVPFNYQLETEKLANVPKSPQGQQESQDLCGPESAVAAAFSVPPGYVQPETQEQIDRITDDMVDTLWAGTGITHENFGGVTPDDMQKILEYIRDHIRPIHWQVVTPTLDNLYRGLEACYIVLVSCNEQDLLAWDKNSNSWVYPFPWHISAGHVLPANGLDNMKNILFADQLNDKNQGYWPVIYQAQSLSKSLSWMAIVQVVGPDPKNPYLKPIPDPDPTKWPAGFNAQNFTQGGGTVVTPTPTPAPGVDNKEASFEQMWTALLPGISTTSGIANDARARYNNGHFVGPVLPQKDSVGNLHDEVDAKDWNGNHVRRLFVVAGYYEWTDQFACNFYPYSH